MQYILDTHVLLWWLADDKALDESKREIIENPNTIIFISAVSTWEIEIKRKLGKLKIPNNFHKVIDGSDFIKLSINISHTLKLADLDDHHNDPFDRLLIAQCLVEKCALLTSDKMMKKYPIKTY